MTTKAARKPAASTNPRQRLEAAVAANQRQNWFDKLSKEKQATVREYLDAMKDTHGATHALVHRVLVQQGVINIKYGAFYEWAAHNPVDT